MKLLSRNDLSLDGRYPEIVAALEAEPCARFAIDGAVVAFGGAQTSFARLAQRDAPVFYYVFDVLWLDGHDVRPLPLRDRKRLLRSALSFQDGVRLTPYRNAEGEALFEEARWPATTPRSPTRRGFATRPGSSPNWSRRSASRSGRAPAACATRASSACASTSRRAPSCASFRRDDPASPLWP